MSWEVCKFGSSEAWKFRSSEAWKLGSWEAQKFGSSEVFVCVSFCCCASVPSDTNWQVWKCACLKTCEIGSLIPKRIQQRSSSKAMEVQTVFGWEAWKIGSSEAGKFKSSEDQKLGRSEAGKFGSSGVWKLRSVEA